MTPDPADDGPSLRAMQERIERLEAILARVDPNAPAAVLAVVASEPVAVGRRQLLGKLAAGAGTAVGAVALGVHHAAPVAASPGQAVLQGVTNDASSTGTTLTSSTGTATFAAKNTGFGNALEGHAVQENTSALFATSEGGYGVFVLAVQAAVYGRSRGGNGVEGVTLNGGFSGVYGEGAEGYGVTGDGALAGVLGRGGTRGHGVQGAADSAGHSALFGANPSGPAVTGTGLKEGVIGRSEEANGVHGTSYAMGTSGVYGVNTTGFGVTGDGSGSHAGVLGRTVPLADPGTGTGVRGIGGAIGVEGTATGAAGIGVAGTASAVGATAVSAVHQAAGTGLTAVSNGGTAVRASAAGTGAGSYGVLAGATAGAVALRASTAHGTANAAEAALTGKTATGTAVAASTLGTGLAVSATSAKGVGLRAAGGAAPLLLVPKATAGAPSSGSHARGELVVDSAGDLFLCTAPGTPGIWRMVVLA